MYSFVARHVLAPALDLMRGTGTMRCLSELEKTQWWPYDKVRELQNQRLRQMLEYAFDNVPYYRRIFEERSLKPSNIESSDDLVKLPLLNKRIIRSNFNDLKAHGFPQNEIVPTSTGGSTGQPLKFLSSKKDQLHWGLARGERARGWAGYDIGDKLVLFRARIVHYTTPPKLIKSAEMFLERIEVVDPATMSTATLPLIVQKLEKFQPKFIGGYPSAIYLLAQFIQKQGCLSFKPEAIMPGGEQVHDYQRELFQEVFKCETYSHYSSFEAYNIAAECPEHTGHHIAAENIIAEVVDDATNPMPAGAKGRILITNLHNYAMPLIRYEIGDAGAISDQPCPCGRGLPLLSKLCGRTNDILFTRSGKSIPGLALPRKFLANLGVEQFQIVQENFDEVRLNIVLDGQYPPERLEEVTKEIKTRYHPILGNDIAININFVAQIVLTESGKRNTMISKLPLRDGRDLQP